jgi:hypothetical protein
MINDIQIYTMTDTAYNYFCSKAKNCRSKPKDFVERKLSSLIHNTTSIKVLSSKDYQVRYTFCGFYMVVDYKNNNIIDLYWENSKHNAKQPNEDLYKRVRETNVLLGLNKNGDGWLNGITPAH